VPADTPYLIKGGFTKGNTSKDQLKKG
jgi:hypothetical protein